MKTSNLIKALLGTVMSFTFAASAMASVVTFEDKTAFSCDFSNLSDGGLNFSHTFAACFYSPAAPADFPSKPPSTVMAIGSNITVTKTGGGTFSLNSVDLAFGPFNHNGATSDTTLVTGHLQGGGTVSTMLTVDLSFDTYNLNWTNLDSVVFSQLINTHEYLAFDNVRFDENTVPEPATVTLFGIAAAGLALGRRRQKA